MNFPNNLSILRRRAGYTQEGLAEALGVSRQAVSKWESGLTLPEAATLLTLADLLSCTLDQLMREELAGAGGEALAAEVTEDKAAQGEDVQEQGEEEEERYALFVKYNKHMDRLAVMMGSGVFLILFSISLMIAGIVLRPYYHWIGLAMMAFFPVCLIVAVGFFIYGGVTDEEFRTAYPVLPDFFSAEALARFQHIYRLGLPITVTGILADVALLVLLAFLFETNETMMVLSAALFLGILGLATGAMTLLGILHDKYDLDHYARHSARYAERHAERAERRGRL